VPFSALSAIERTHLKDAFRAVRAWQETAAYHFQSRFL
jgi:signal-transduction protein with cAMP-binding, CBS, and nucleotidyltransferase domain